MIDFWSITGATLAILALLIGVVYFLINQIKKRLDQAIGIVIYTVYIVFLRQSIRTGAYSRQLYGILGLLFF